MSKPKYEVVKTVMFEGLVKDDTGKIHNVRQTWCENCGKLTAETHQFCCGYASSGWVSGPCDCQGKSTDLNHVVFGGKK